jgi:two-component system OmpR family sensor kinase
LVVEDVAGIHLFGDARRIEQVLVNLLINASRYSGPDTEIVISARPLGSRVRIEVRDEGPGVVAEERERIFDRYARGSSAQRTGNSGLGLGLHIVKTLVELHGGEVGVESEPGQGARFWFCLPAVDASDEQPIEWEQAKA